MFRTFLTTLLVAVIFVAKANAGGYANVDLQLALETVKDGATAKAKLEKEFKDKQKMLQNREEEIKKMTADYQKKQLVLTPEKRAQEEQTIQKKMADYRDLMQQSQVQMQKREVELTKPIIDNMRGILAEIAEKEKYDLVYEKNQSGIFYAKDAKEITSDLIEKYNSTSSEAPAKDKKKEKKK
ncbi:MAG: OmpH family outer membrane protein [bacterium]